MNACPSELSVTAVSAPRLSKPCHLCCDCELDFWIMMHVCVAMLPHPEMIWVQNGTTAIVDALQYVLLLWLCGQVKSFTLRPPTSVYAWAAAH